MEPTIRDAGKALDPGARPATAGKEVEMHALAEKFHLCRGENCKHRCTAGVGGGTVQRTPEVRTEREQGRRLPSPKLTASLTTNPQ